MDDPQYEYSQSIEGTATPSRAKRGRKILAGAQPAGDDEEQDEEEHSSLIMTLGSIDINYDCALQYYAMTNVVVKSVWFSSPLLARGDMMLFMAKMLLEQRFSIWG